MASERGEYRAIMNVLWGGKDFQRLSGHARLTFLALKSHLGWTGIDVLHAARYVLSENTGWTPDQVDQSLGELESSGWIRRDHNVYWVIDGILYEPSMHVGNWKHRTGLREHMKGLPNVPLVAEFKARHRDWLQDDVESGTEAPEKAIQTGIDTVSDTVSEGYPKGIETVADHIDFDFDVDVDNKTTPAAKNAAVGGRKSRKAKGASDWTSVFAQDWFEITKGVEDRVKLGKAIKPLAARLEVEPISIRPDFQAFARSKDAKFGVGYFVKHYGRYKSAGTGNGVSKATSDAEWRRKNGY